VPISAFKSVELATFPVGQAAAVFESSGTTREVRSRHYLKTLSYYEASLKFSFKKWVAAAGPYYILTPSPAEAPRSSLSWMMDVVKRTFGAAGSEYLVQHGRLDEMRLASLLSKAEKDQKPGVLLGTTIAFLAFFDYASKTGKTFHLASGSRLMDTGGMKTEKRRITRLEFVRQAGDILGIPESECVNEYGMCELGSQFYGRGASSYLEGPPWTRILVGEDGHLRYFDLANVDSVLAIQTDDIGAVEGKGFVFQGRDPNADVKGCSLSAEAFLS
jgi:hypothetical protein